MERTCTKGVVLTMEKARIINKEKPGLEAIEVMFNPPTLKISSSNSYADSKTPGTDKKEKQQYIKTNSDMLTVELFFDTTRTNSDVRAVVQPILELTKVDKTTKEPPNLIFAWGSLNFDCIIISIDHSYEYFNSDGNAMRATLSVKFKSSEPKSAVKEEPLKAAAKKVKTVVVKAGQNCTCICEGKPPEDWREIAELNELDNPLASQELVGQTLYTPADNGLYTPAGGQSGGK